LRWVGIDGRLWLEGLVSYAEEQDDLSTRDEGDTQRIPPGGTPDYTVVTLRSHYQVTRHLGIALALENITDEDYRIHGSGINEPGRNLVMTLSWRPQR
jgi:hemoglobin/transferrin/lactoferrin receptor protein